MKLHLPNNVGSRLIDALQKAGEREIGGVLVGEHIGPDTFRVLDITIQRKRGTFASFMRVVEEIVAPLKAFFQRTKNDYRRFNYMGEWHSHHSFNLEPSGRDHKTMFELIDDPQFGARFAVLLLVRLSHAGQLETAVTVYQPQRNPYSGKVVLEGEQVQCSD